MAKIRGYTSTYSSNYSQWGRRRRLWWQRLGLGVFLFLPLLLLLAELAVRGVVTFTKAEGWIGLGNIPASIEQAYKLNPEAEQGGLLVKPDPLLGYSLQPNQTSPFWQINGQGFRSDTDTTVLQRKGDFYVFLVGNSTAFGYGAESNGDSLGTFLESALNRTRPIPAPPPDTFEEQPIPRAPSIDVRFKVITAAVPGYSSGNELGLLAQRLLAYPIGALVVLDGYEDLRLSSSASATEIAPPRQELTRDLAEWWHSLYLVRAGRKLLGHSPAPVSTLSAYQTFHENRLAFDPQELQARINRLRDNWQKMSQAVVNVPTLIALQPVILGKQNFTAPESQIMQKLGATYRQRLETSLKSLELIKPGQVSQRANFRLVNLNNFYRGSTTPDFMDAIHLSKSANQSLADHLAQQLFPLLPKATAYTF